ncbi:hypothetical protein K437DRAFT_119816 [Tilletiaria anomala UBC 951]|uniref:RING-type domain-containing protein n=1 Tax=Tilletiaria anomala (strain ATCC 24038 / CBS 436.72 / UBC 951) TaxID=1037660 RepID=A0A066VZR1_TILAU|nr:uncharacterized protein K437DRAFT_119816 [Tilletiaria anomala UBC 951]KDN45773.1 hypothetical protein K437DRAFT_119816 [Tilletiaria anomala UBC 951]
MGQANGKERAEDGSAGHRRTPSAGAGSSGSSSHPRWPKGFDGGALEPQGVYTGIQDYSHDVVKRLITSRRLAPFYAGAEDDETYAHVFDGEVEQTECPICFLNYPSPCNQTRCCEQPICSECFVQMKRADPNHTNPPSSEPAACPFCMQSNFGVVYHPPQALLDGHRLQGGGQSSRRAIHPSSSIPQSTSGVPGVSMTMPEGSAIDSSFSIRDAASPTSPATEHRRRKSFNHSDPEVVTIDMIRPDWQAKLASAQAAIARRANRRIIMRQVGDRLIPVGISSSRLGQELPAGTGPGGAIILQQGQELALPPGFQATAAEQRGERRRSGTGRRQQEIARYLHTLSAGQDLEEAMMMEAMRLSLLEHEEQQRRQAEEARRQRQAQPQQTPQVCVDTSATAPPQQAPTPSSSPSSHAANNNHPSSAAAAPQLFQSSTPDSTHPSAGSHSPTVESGAPTAPLLDLGVPALSVEATLSRGERVSMLQSSSMMQDLAELLGTSAIGESITDSSAANGVSTTPAAPPRSVGADTATSHPHTATVVPPPAPVDIPTPVPEVNTGSSRSSAGIGAAALSAAAAAAAAANSSGTGAGRSKSNGSSHASLERIGKILPKPATNALRSHHAGGAAASAASPSGSKGDGSPTLQGYARLDDDNNSNSGDAGGAAGASADQLRTASSGAKFAIS